MQWSLYRCIGRIPPCLLYRLRIPVPYRTTPPHQGNWSERRKRARCENAAPAVLRKSNPVHKGCGWHRSEPHLPGSHFLCGGCPPACRPKEGSPAFSSTLPVPLPPSFHPDNPSVCWLPGLPEFPLSLPPSGPADGEDTPDAVIFYRMQSPAPQNILLSLPVFCKNPDVQSDTPEWLRYRKSFPSCAFPMPADHPLPHPQRRTPFCCGILMRWDWP